jgi:serine/threonine protein kinase
MEEFSKSVGTRLFSSPEQATSENYDHRTDIFSLAMVIVLLFCSFTTVHHQRDLLEAIRLRKLEDIHMPERLKNMMYRCLGSEEERASVIEIQGLLR